MTTEERIRRFRKGFPKEAVIFCEDRDAHGSEIPSDRFCLRSWLSGFHGSHGSLLVTKEHALLWTDGRYFSGASALLKDSPITVLKEEDDPSPSEWIHSHSLADSPVYFYLPSAQELRDWQSALSPRNIVPFSDIAPAQWPDRPSVPKTPVYLFSSPYREKRARCAELRSTIKDSEHLLITDLCDIAWCLPIRGSDIPDTPVFLSYLLLSAKNCSLFLAGPDRLENSARRFLDEEGIVIRPYEDITSVLRELEGCLVYDPAKTDAALVSEVSSAQEMQPLPSEGLKSIKTKKEIAGMHHAHLRDGVAVVRFLHWLSSCGTLPDESGAAEVLRDFRSEEETYISESFQSIAAVGPHAAMPHYHATQRTNRALSRNAVFLIDSGAHYTSGTSDITRTLWPGDASQKERQAYTLVLKAHISLASLPFPRDTSGRALDAIARDPLWRAFHDFDHGTGHGVGFVTSVHEAPPNIGRSSTKGLNPLAPGMVLSIEPGLYFEDNFGIRIENLYVVKEHSAEFLSFEVLTLAPISTAPVIKDLLSTEEIAWINAYHKLVYRKLHTSLAPETAAWLRAETSPL